MMHAVFLLSEAIEDLESIYLFIRNSGSKATATKMVGTIREACNTLSETPERGHIPMELSRLCLIAYRQIIVNRYRVIYQVAIPNVFVLGIIHCNRDIGEVLQRRLLVDRL